MTYRNTPQNWSYRKLSNLVFFQRGFDITQAEQKPGDIPVISSSGVSSHHSAFKAEGPGVVIGRKGTLGKVHFVDENYWPHDTTLWSKDLKGNNPRFVYYFLQTLDFKQFDVGSSNPTLNRNHIHDLDVAIPPLSEQNRIAEYLCAYDDLIENNRRRMTLLEESARLLYQEWFIRLRFPGHEHARITDGVPEGWERVPTPEAIEINPKTKLSDDDEHWYVEMADLPTDSMVINGAVMRDGRSGSKFRNGDTLLARITPCLENGKTGFVNFMSPGEVGRGSTEFIVLRSKRVTPEFVYCLARTYDFREHAIKSMVGSSGRQRVRESCFEKFRVFIPPAPLLNQFSEIARPNFEQIKNLHAQNQKLRTARDLLLPRLMSGEITV
ncbi:restriction endonuclease subunit S [Zoogloea sp.]|uniref:restriction endonuclease subunit S n=1 Tax=Zoogloea sp. TaxID=49181 RepID=UPI0035B4218F